MTVNNYKDPIISQWNIANGKKYSKPIYNEPHIVAQGMFALIGLPDIGYRVIIDGYSEIDYRDEIKTARQFKVDYSNGYVFFHADNEGESINVTEYASRGVNYYPASRIWTKLNDIGEVTQTLDDLIKEVESLPTLVSTLENTINKTYLAKEALDSTISNSATTMEDINGAITIANINLSELNVSIKDIENIKLDLEENLNRVQEVKDELIIELGRADDFMSKLDESLDMSIELKTLLDDMVVQGDIIRNDILSSLSIGEQLIDELSITIADANISKIELNNSLINANEIINTLNSIVTDANNINDKIQINIQEANDIDDKLSNTEIGSIIRATLINDELKTSIDNADNIKSGLEININNANEKINLAKTVISELGERITVGSELKEDLNDIISGTDYENIITDISNLKRDQHIHTNKDILDKLSDDNGALKYDGQDIGSGDMSKSEYDVDGDGMIDIAKLAESVEYSNIANIPDAFNPMAHSHSQSEILDLDKYSRQETDDKISNINRILEEKVDNSRVLTDVPENAQFTDTLTTINGKTGEILKEDIVSLGIPSKDTIVDIVDDLDSNESSKALAAKQGNVLKTQISDLKEDLGDINDNTLPVELKGKPVIEQNAIILSKAEQAFQSASDGKQQIATAITGKGITADGGDTFLDLANKIEQIETDKTGDATAAASDILLGKTAYSKGNKLTGTIPSKAASTITPNETNQIITAGQYLSGNQTIAGDINLVPANIAQGKSIFGKAGTYKGLGNAVAGDVLASKTFSTAALSNATGTMVNRGAVTNTITTQGGAYTIPVGYHSGTGKVTATLANLAAGNVRNGINIGGVVGTFKGGWNITISELVGADSRGRVTETVRGYLDDESYVSVDLVVPGMTSSSTIHAIIADYIRIDNITEDLTDTASLYWINPIYHTSSYSLNSADIRAGGMRPTTTDATSRSTGARFYIDYRIRYRDGRLTCDFMFYPPFVVIWS